MAPVTCMLRVCTYSCAVIDVLVELCLLVFVLYGTTDLEAWDRQLCKQD